MSYPFDLLQIWIPERPVPMGRPRVTRRGTFTPERSRIAKRTVSAEMLKARVAAGWTRPTVDPCSLCIGYYFKATGPRLKELKANVAPNLNHFDPSPFPHVIRPDLDNLEKLVKDAGNRILWTDDCLIFHVEHFKAWWEVPGILISVRAYKAPIYLPSPLTLQIREQLR